MRVAYARKGVKMKQGKFLALIISLVTAMVMAFSTSTFAYASETDVLVSANGATITANENVFDSNTVFTVTDAVTSSDSVSALIYYNDQAYKKVEYGFKVDVLTNEESLISLPSEATFSVPTTLSGLVQIAYVLDNCEVEIIDAYINSTEDSYITFNSSKLGEFWVLTDNASTLDGVGVLEASRVLAVNMQAQSVSLNTYCVKYINAIKPGLKAAKSFSSDVTVEKQTVINELLNLYKKASINYLDSLYNKNDYSVTENGICAINELKALTKNAINSAYNVDEIDLAVTNFKSQIDEDKFSKKRSTLKLNGNFQASVTAYELNEDKVSYSELLAFSDDASLSLTEVKDQIKVKNTNLALLENQNVITNGGVYKYLNVKVVENDVINTLSYDKLTVKISLESLGITLADNEVLQVAKYVKNKQVELIAVTVEDGYMIFDVTEFGDYAIVKEGCALQNTSEFIAFFETYGALCGATSPVIIIIILAISSASKKRKKQEQREYKAFKKAQKLSKKKSKKKSKS